MARGADEDGWFSWSSLAAIVAPALAIERAAQAGTTTLRLVRTVFTAYAISLVLIWVVVGALNAFADEPDSSDQRLASVAGGIAVWGVVALLLARVLSKPPGCTSNSALAAWYRTRFFLRIAFASSAALVGFVSPRTRRPPDLEAGL